jgi:hypothetical protein
MVKCGVLFEVRPGFLNNIYTSFGFNPQFASGFQNSVCFKISLRNHAGNKQKSYDSSESKCSQQDKAKPKT